MILKSWSTMNGGEFIILFSCSTSLKREVNDSYQRNFSPVGEKDVVSQV